MPRSDTRQQAAIIERIRFLMKHLGMTQVRFAERINVNAANFSKHLSGKLPISTGLINRIALDFGINRNWLVNGTDTPYSKPEADHAMMLAPSETLGRIETRNVSKGIPVYDIDVTAGFGELSRMFTDDRLSGVVDLPQLGVSDGVRIVRVSGDSMEPLINNGGYIALREIQSKTIFWGQIYVVILEDYRMVKIVRRHADPDRLILHSVNPDYDDIEIARSEVIGLYLVEGIINYRQQC
ncbi:MAG: hypothetical protein K2G94_01585 [Muribaculaceae bacterium]|nr:hypothetical protein [Muribaculaceae bacterium]MDE5971419.1 hypothetical protein [Muribaculaceae bacterium]MDE6461634.1 hypothetical protein [Muribaculaceae bacterium]